MRILATGALSRLGLRLGERRQRTQAGDRPALTSDDEANIADFESLVGDAIRLLAHENDALVEGDVAGVAGFHEAKLQLLRELTLKQPVIEPFLREEIEPMASLRALLREFAEQLRKNGELLSGMASASRSILSEVERVRQRQSLNGVYDKTGQVRRDLDRRDGKIVKNL